jgi:hypothetical protein
MEENMQLLTNHIGYHANSEKRAILMASLAQHEVASAFLVDAQGDDIVLELNPIGGSKVDNWHMGVFFTIDFSQWTEQGRYYLRYQNIKSQTFEVGDSTLHNRSFSDIIHYFKSQRCGGEFDIADKSALIVGSSQRVDVHGGWYDASGDVSKYLSHLSYANYLNPQQIPMVVWNMLKAYDLIGKESEPNFVTSRLLEEALHGAEFLKRMQHPSGYFYMTVFDKWSKDTAQREICAYETQLGHKKSDYEAGFRQGGGMSIAALAKTSQVASLSREQSQDYLEAAKKGYWHLKERNSRYLNDQTANIIDEYCALMACIALFQASSEQQYLSEVRDWVEALSQRAQGDQQHSFYWSANSDGSRPYFHAAEAGLPVIALTEYLAIEPDRQRALQVQSLLTQACQFEVSITCDTYNPFGYPRQYVKAVDGNKHNAFFIPHNNESGYWWQGENARIASLASMALLAQPHLVNDELKAQLEHYANNCINWILGANPYDMCMLDGHGYNNPDYLPEIGFFNALGGVCNGITSGFEDESDIAFKPEKHKDDMLQNWRWGEQWIPHAGWLLLALALWQQHYKK